MLRHNLFLVIISQSTHFISLEDAKSRNTLILRRLKGAARASVGAEIMKSSTIPVDDKQTTAPSERRSVDHAVTVDRFDSSSTHLAKYTSKNGGNRRDVSRPEVSPCTIIST